MSKALSTEVSTDISAGSPTAAPRTVRAGRHALTTTLALAAAGLLLTPVSAHAAGGATGPGGPGGPKNPAPKPPSGPVQTVTRVSTGKVLTAAKAVTISAHVAPARRSAPGTKGETGTVVFTVDGTASSPIPVAKNRAAEKLKLTAGKHTVSAKYSGDSTHTASESGPVSITVSGGPAT